MIKPEIFIEAYGKKFKWYLISEWNSHVIAQGVVAKTATAYRHAQEALYDYLELTK